MEGLIVQKLNKIEQILTGQIDKPLTIQEAADYLGFSKSHLYKLTAQNKIHHYKPQGKMIYFNKMELNEWVYGKSSQQSEVSSQKKNK